MSPPTAARLGHHLRRLDRESLAAFLADLYAARGFETRRDGDVVVATRDGNRTVVGVATPRLLGRDDRTPDRSVDVLVAVGRDGADAAPAVSDATRVHTPRDVRDALAYALDRETAANLCARHLGAPFEALAPAPRERVRARADAAGARLTTAAGTVRARSPIGPGALAVAVATVLVVGLAVGTGAVPVGPDGDDATTDAPGGEGTSDAAAGPAGALGGNDGDGGEDGPRDGDDAGATDADGGGDRQVGPPGTTLVPGLSREGIENVSALGRAHDRGLANRSYTLWLDFYGPKNASAPGVRVQRDVDVTVTADRYRAEYSLEENDTRTRTRSLYHDGRAWYVADYDAAGPNVSYTRYGPDESELVPLDPADVRRSLVVRYLNTRTSAVTGLVERDGRTLYRVVATGNPAGFVPRGEGSYRAVALVDAEGVVHDLAVEYTRPFADRVVEVRVEATYARLDETTVTAPAWYDTEFAANANATAATAAGAA
jgi:hypothetical protein